MILSQASGAYNTCLDAMPRSVKWFFRKRARTIALIIIFAVWAALFMGGNMPIFWTAPIAMAMNLLLVWGLITLYRKKVGKKYTMRELLPDGSEFWILLGILMMIYIPLGFLWDPEKIAGFTGQGIILILYTFFFGLLILNIRSSKKRKLREFEVADLKMNWKIALIIFSIFAVISLMVGFSGIGVIFIILSFFFGIMIGFISLGITVYQAFES